MECRVHGGTGATSAPSSKMRWRLEFEAALRRWEEGTGVAGILKKAGRDLGVRAPEGRPAISEVMPRGRCVR